MVCECEICAEMLQHAGGASVARKEDEFLRGFTFPIREELYETQLGVKCRIEERRWERNAPAVQIVRSPPLGHRLRVKFLLGQSETDKVWRYGVSEDRDGNTNLKPTFQIERCSVATPRIQSCMQTLLTALNKDDACPLLFSGLHAVNFVDTMGQLDFLLALYYLEKESAAHDNLSAWKKSVQHHIIGPLQSAVKGRLTVALRQKGVLETTSMEPSGFSHGNHEMASLVETGLFKGKTLVISEGSFSNPNGAVTRDVNRWLEKMLRLLLKGRQARLIELCSGAGNHTIGLCDFFKQCICIEIDRRLVERARVNIQANGIENIHLVRDDMKRLGAILRRHKFAIKDGQAPTVVLVDPPRCGLDADTARFVGDLDCDFLIYVACGQGLVLNSASLDENFEMIHLCLADHFPFTHFLEKIAIYKRKETN